MAIPNLRVSRLKSLVTGILREKPGLTSKELYGRVCQTPIVVAFREQKFPGYKPPSTTPETLVQKLSTKSKKKVKKQASGASQSTSATSTATVAPTRKFFHDHVLAPLLHANKLYKEHKLIKPTEEEAAQLPQHVVQRAQKARRHGPLRIDVWQLHLTPPKVPRLIPLAPRRLALSPSSELEIRRKAGEFDHLNRRRKRLIMRRAEVEIKEGQEALRKEWRASVALAKQAFEEGVFDPQGWEKGKGFYGRTEFPEPKAVREPLKGIRAEDVAALGTDAVSKDASALAA